MCICTSVYPYYMYDVSLLTTSIPVHVYYFGHMSIWIYSFQKPTVSLVGHFFLLSDTVTVTQEYHFANTYSIYCHPPQY